MKKIKTVLGIIFLGVAATVATPAQAQRGSDETFGVGTTTFNIGIGLGNTYGSGYYNYGSYGTGIGLKVALEHGLWQLGPGVLSLGAEAGASYSNGNYYLYSGSNYKSTVIGAAVRAAYHYGFGVSGLDAYGGVPLGVGLRSYHDFDANGNLYSRHQAIPIYGIFAGGSYFFSPNFGVNVEAGYDITNLQGGIIFKF